MEFDSEGRSSDIQDRRGEGFRPFRLGIGGVILVSVISLLLGRNPLEVLGLIARQQQSAPRNPGSAPTRGPRNPEERTAERLVRQATTDIQDFWQAALPQMTEGRRSYPRTQLVLFADETHSQIGRAHV